MPELNASGDIFNLEGNADYSEGIVHGRVGGDARVSFTAELEACHGIDAAIAAEALAEIQGIASILLPALRAEGSAFARIGANASVQLSPNVFDKVGLTIDLQGQAQAAVAGRIAIGLDFETIAALARDQLSDLAYELFIAFLNELVIEAGVWGRAAFSAMANAHLEVNGSLGSDDDAGFAITAGAGVGWGGGTGWDFYAGLHLIDPKRFYSTASHLISDEIVRQARQHLGPEYGAAITLLDLLLPTSLSASFELGQLSALELIDWAGQSDGAAPFGKSFQVELQRLIMDKLVEAGGILLTRLTEVFLPKVSAALVPAERRDELEQNLETLIEGLRGGSMDLQRFVELANHIVTVVEVLAPGQLSAWRRPIALTWCALALAEGIRRGARRAGAGASVGLIGTPGVSAHVTLPAMPPPPDIIVPELQRFLDPYPDELQPADAIDYLARSGLLPTLADMLPELADPLASLTDMLSDQADLTPGDLLEAALLGAFGGDLSDTELYRRLRGFAKDAIDHAILEELLPALRAALDDGADAMLYLREVVEPSFRITGGYMFGSLDRLVSASNQPALGDAFYNTFQHGMSAVVYKIFVRNLVVISDILISHAIAGLNQGFVDLNQAVESDPDHVLLREGAELATLVLPAAGAPDAELREATHGFVSELTAAGVEAFGEGVWTEHRRLELRALLIRVLESIDTQAEGSDDQMEAFFEELAECYFVGDLEGVQRILTLLGQVTADELEVVFRRIVPAVQSYMLLLTRRSVADHEKIVTEFMAGLAATLEKIKQEVARLATELAEFLDELADAARAAAEAYVAALAKMSDSSLREAIVAEVRSMGLDNAEAMARAVPGFPALPPAQQQQAIATAQGAFLLSWLLIRPAVEAATYLLGDLGDELSEALDSAANVTELHQSVAASARATVEADVADQAAVDGFQFPDALSLSDIGLAVQQTILNQAAILQSLTKALTERTTREELQATVDAARQAHQSAIGKLQQQETRVASLRGGPIDVRILSPASITARLGENWLYADRVPLYIRVPGAHGAFVQSGAPQRIFLALNGRPLSIQPAAWQVDKDKAELFLRMELSAAGHGLQDGLNTIECSVFDGEGQLVRGKASFAVDTGRRIMPGDVLIAGDLSQFDAPGNDHLNATQEYVVLQNGGKQELNLSGWRIRDRAGHTYTFGTHKLRPGQSLRLHTGQGEDTGGDLFWGMRHAVWNNHGDAVYVLDHERMLVAEHVY